LSEFHEHAPNVKNFQFLEKKDKIFRKIRENFGNVQIIQKIIQNYSKLFSRVPTGCAARRGSTDRPGPRVSAEGARLLRSGLPRTCQGLRDGSRNSELHPCHAEQTKRKTAASPAKKSTQIFDDLLGQRNRNIENFSANPS
jgi:hypothetical protein